MFKKVLSLLTTGVAISALSMAISIPVASAHTLHSVSPRGCEYTEDTQSNQYCESQSGTTVANGTTIASTSPAFTIAKPAASPTSHTIVTGPAHSVSTHTPASPASRSTFTSTGVRRDSMERA